MENTPIDSDMATFVDLNIQNKTLFPLMENTPKYEDIKKIIKQIRNHIEIKDMSRLLTSFKELTALSDENEFLISELLYEEIDLPPYFFVQFLVEIEDFINDVWNDRVGRKNLSKKKFKSLAFLRQEFRKYVKHYPSVLIEFREKTDLSYKKEDQNEYEDVDSDDRESEDETLTASFKKTEEKIPKVQKNGEVSYSLILFDDGNNSDSSEDKGYYEYQSIGEWFIKKSTDNDDDESDEEDESYSIWQKEKSKTFAKYKKVTSKAVLLKLTEVIAAYGKECTDRIEQIGMLYELLLISETRWFAEGLIVKIKMSIISSIFDYYFEVSDTMKPKIWSKLLNCVVELLNSILPHRGSVFIGESVAEDDDSLFEPNYRVRGCVLTIVERLDDEFKRSLKECNPRSMDYAHRLKNEIRICQIIDKAQLFLEEQNIKSEVCRIYMRNIDHLYYKFNVFTLRTLKYDLVGSSFPCEPNLIKMEKLCHYIYANDNTNCLKPRTFLCQAYYYAFHHSFFNAEQILSRAGLLNKPIQDLDPEIQILYNRTMACMGLSAFQAGNIQHAHKYLVDLMMTGKVKELLGQGLSPQRLHELNEEQKKVEKQRQMPFHMHIDLQVLEGVYLVSAMFKETAREYINQQQHSSEYQYLTVPPVSIKDNILAAGEALRNGNLSACRNFLINVKMNSKVWYYFLEKDKIKDILEFQLKKISFSKYIQNHSDTIHSVSTNVLSAMFKLPEDIIQNIIFSNDDLF
ncbi:eukaryotic translation initiation factor 3 subunit C-like [Melanaphis sacchari]|nr:eukaryotic translation initiation factor 3 subunit C-like [Melanaphis sacchari]XP_025207244.1 eukaryotic translation initiation factor 3 subunit C-like [Melanaphis sacchari]XP_025207245.1 eukaryotic translation initiation factor 3 subunit C-like [Melanaphis sacchari]